MPTTLRTTGTISIPVYALDESRVVMDILLATYDDNGAVKVTWTFFDNLERHMEIHPDLATALLRVGVLVSTTADDRVREYNGSDRDFARRARDFIVMTTA